MQWKRLREEWAHSSQWAINPRAGDAWGRDYRAGKGADRRTGIGHTLEYSIFFSFKLYWDINGIINCTYLKYSIFKVLVYVYIHETISTVKDYKHGHHFHDFQFIYTGSHLKSSYRWLLFCSFFFSILLSEFLLDRMYYLWPPWGLKNEINRQAQDKSSLFSLEDWEKGSNVKRN